MTEIVCRTQAEFESAARGSTPVILAAGSFVLDFVASSQVITLHGSSKLEITCAQSSRVVARDNSRVEARGHSSVVVWGRNSSVEAWGSSRVVAQSSRVEALDNSSVVAWGNSRVEAWGSSRVEAWGSSSVVARDNSRVEARGHSSVVARDNSRVEARGHSSVVVWGRNSSVEAWGDVLVRAYGGRSIKAAPTVIVKIHEAPAELEGGQQIPSVEIVTVQDWCAYHGVKTEGEKALLFKGVNADLRSDRGGDYTPGTIPVCADWDGGVIECGRGYHVSPHPRMTREFCIPEKYVAGWVHFNDIAIHPDGTYPHKVKIRGYSDPVWECDADGNAVGNGGGE